MAGGFIALSGAGSGSWLEARFGGRTPSALATAISARSVLPKKLISLEKRQEPSVSAAGLGDLQ